MFYTSRPATQKSRVAPRNAWIFLLITCDPRVVHAWDKTTTHVWNFVPVLRDPRVIHAWFHAWDKRTTHAWNFVSVLRGPRMFLRVISRVGSTGLRMNMNVYLLSELRIYSLRASIRS